MSYYSLDQIAQFYGRPKRTLENHIKKLKERKLFQRTAIGGYYDDTEVSQLSELLRFKFPHQEAQQKTT